MARALLESEVKVQEQKSNYTFTLRAQFEALTIQIASHPLAAEFEWKGEGTMPNKTGPQLLAENDDENKRWLAELEARRAFVGSSLEDVRSKLEAAEKHAAQESKRLADQRAQQVAVLYDLELYEEQLESRSPRAAVIQPPKRRPKDAAEGARMEALAAARRAEEARLAAVRLAATPLDCS
jgi:hypothetical protein